MSETQLRSYRLTSLEELTDEMLHAIMEKLGELPQNDGKDK